MPSLHPTGPRSHHSALPGSPPLRPAKPQLCLGPTDLCSTRLPAHQHQPARPQNYVGPPDLCSARLPAQQVKPHSAGQPDLHSTGPQLHRLARHLLDLCSAGPHTTGPPGTLSAGPQGHCSTRPPRCRPARSPLGPCPAGSPGPYSTGLLDSCSTRPLYGRPTRSLLCQASTPQAHQAPACPSPTTGGLQTCLQDAERQEWVLKE
jgi:hypothetical protein